MSSKGYSNYKLFSKDGRLLCNISKRRAQWYLKKDLAVQLSPTEIQLLFKENGESLQHKVISEHRDNICVFCGTADNLTSHHIVPYRFKKHFPSDYKACNSFDVTLLCRTCHDTYEIEATKFTDDLLARHSITKCNTRSKEVWAAQILLKEGNKLPTWRYAELFNTIPVEFRISEEALKDFANSHEKRLVNKELVDRINDIPKFIVMWRKHFAIYANPKFMPASWYEEIDKVFLSN